jgi:hypothetical protein
MNRVRAGAVWWALTIGGGALAQSPAGAAAETRPETVPATRGAVTPESAAETVLGDKPTVRKQAVAWINAHLEQGGPALAAALLRDPPSRLNFDGVRATGGVKHARVTEALLALVDRPGFLWRPQALEALADHAAEAALPRFEAAVNDSVWRSRAAACRGIAALRAKRQAPLLEALAEDEEAPVRLESAKARWTFGDPGGLAFMVRDLSLDRRFMDADHGSVARDAAATFLNEVCGAGSFPVPHPVLELQGLIAALGKVRAVLGDRAGGFPEIVPPHEPDAVGHRYAIEVRSCIDGDLYLRFDEEGSVVFGRDRLDAKQVPAELTKSLGLRLGGFDYGARGRAFFHPINCDFERYGVFVDRKWRSVTFGVGRRPASFAPFEEDLLKIVKAAYGPPAAAAHAARAKAFAEAP